MTQSFGVMSFMFLALVLGLFSSSAVAQTTLISASGNGGFETGTTFAANNWTAVSGSVDAWEVGAAVSPGASAGARSAYVSTNLGTTWAYSQINTIEHLYYDVTIPAGESLVTLTFKWKATGEGAGTSDWDNIKVFWGPAGSLNPTANTALTTNQVSGPGAISGMYKLSSATYNSETISFTGVPGTVYRLVFSWKTDGSVIANPPAAIDEVNLVSSTPSAFASAQGGLWSSPATWVGGIVPPSGNNVTITAGHIVTVDQNVTTTDLIVSGTLQYGPNTVSPGYTTTIAGNFTISNGGRFLHYNTGLGFVQPINIAGNFENNGFANCFLSAITFNNVSGIGTTVSGTGTFLGDGIGTRGIIRTMSYTSTGANTINTSQNIVSTSGLNLTAGSLNTRLATDTFKG